MKILHVAAECYPMVRTGGLGDVLGALPVALGQLGHDVRLLLPGYPTVLQALEVSASFELGFDEDGRVLKTVLPATGLSIYVLDVPRRFARPGNPYLGPDGNDWPDNAARFALLGKAAAALASGAIDPDWRADVLHAHDWHGGLAPAYLNAAGNPVRSVFTIHNIAFQGLFPAATMAEIDLPASLFQPSGLEFWNQVSFLKAGLVYADRVTTVSPGYAREIATVEFGCGLEGVIAARGADVSGILNGVDDAVWNPAADPLIGMRFDLTSLSARAGNRQALLAELALPPPAGPFFGVVSRLTEQKGLDLLLGALPALTASGGALALLGSGDAALEAAFVAAAERYPEQVSVRIGYDDAFSHRLMAGCDAIVVPSRFEPCGLTQLYALRYGAVPVVRRTGGLADTVVDANPSGISDGSATGIVFDDATIDAMAAALTRTAALYADQEAWQALQRNGMRRRFSWREAALAYAGLYRMLIPAG